MISSLATRPDDRGSWLHRFFLIGVAFKGIDGVLELAGGVLFAVVTPERLHAVVRTLTQHELGEDPGDIVANAAMRFSRHLSAHTHVFGAIYLVSHGVIKLALVAGLLAGKRWVHLAAIGIFAVFLAYQAYRYSLNGSVPLLVLSGLDIGVIVLTWLDYRRLRASAGR